MNTAAPNRFTITRIGKKPETIPADSFSTEGDPPKYIFRKAEKVVLAIFIHALESEPKGGFPETPEQKAARRKSVARLNAAMEMPRLLPE